MSGGQWLMALASNGEALSQAGRKLPVLAAHLNGPALQLIDEPTLHSALQLPPYLQGLLG